MVFPPPHFKAAYVIASVQLFLPLTRGNTCCAISTATYHHISPARGTLNRRQPHRRSQRFYPRWRGEHGQLEIVRNRVGGLSSRWRGETMRDCTPSSTPAERRWRGGTQGRRQEKKVTSGLSRWRGEHNGIAAGVVTMGGLSPGAEHSCGGVDLTGSWFISLARGTLM